MNQHTRKLHEALIRAAKAMLAAWEKWLGEQPYQSQALPASPPMDLSAYEQWLMEQPRK